MEIQKILFTTNKAMACILFLSLTIAFTASARILGEQPEVPVVPPEPVSAVDNPVTDVSPPTTPLAPTQPIPTGAAGSGAGATMIDPGHTLSFFMHDILGGTNPSARAVTGIVSNPAVGGQVPFAKPNGANLPLNNGVPQNNNNNGLINNNNLPFLTGLGGTTQPVAQNNGNNFNNAFNLPLSTGGNLPSGSALQQLMFGTITAIDDEITEGKDLESAFIGKAQGFYVASSVDGTSQTMAFTVMFQSGHYADSLSFFGVHRTGVSESQLAIMGGTGKYVNAQGFAIVKTIPSINQHATDGVETLLEFAVYVSY
ncbi:DIRIGENT PROTEIN 24-RELATED [Salix viminalis]|uniref:Dirigent protein n=1 Tax=Salix viminalis TaxID=40686 RepID=A0A9Q0TYY0_SALVM|nr:DIRIGENT PROTEIN 24-RELATED [Salix viminalis]